jgi:stage II sporulation protein AA (anti-sigma F factor antagonist)
MRQVTFRDSSGINILIAAYQASLRQAAGCVWPAPPAPCYAPCSSVDALLDCRPTLREALSP